MMSPWKILGWLLVALLLLLMAAGVYGLSFLYDWPLPSATIVAVTAGGLVGLGLLLWFALTLHRRGRGAPAPLPVNLPRDGLPRWVLVDNGALFPHLPELFQSTGFPLLPLEENEEAQEDKSKERVGLWSTKGAHWLVVSSAKGGSFVSPHNAQPPQDDSAAGNGAQAATSTWDRLFNDKEVRRWLALPTGIVLCLDMDSLGSSHGKDAIAHVSQRAWAIGRRFGTVPMYLLVTGLERAPGLPELARALAAEALPGSHSLHAPLGWIMPEYTPWTSLSRWACAGVEQGMTRLTQALDALVGCSDAGASVSALGAAALLLKTGLQPLAMPLAALAAKVRFNGVFWVALPGACRDDAIPSSSPSSAAAWGVDTALFVRELLLETLPHAGSGASFPLVGRRRQLRMAGRVALTFLALAVGMVLYQGAERGAALLPRMQQWDESLAQAASIAEMDDLMSQFRELERACSGAVHLYDAPHQRLKQMRKALKARLMGALPPGDDMDQWVKALRLWAGTRPGVEALRFRASDGTLLARVDGAATEAGRKAALRFLHDVALFTTGEKAGDNRDAQRMTQPDPMWERLNGLLSRFDALTLASWHAAGQSLLLAVQQAGIASQTPLPRRHNALTMREILGPDNPCVTFLSTAERELRSLGASVPVWVASLRDIRRIRLLTRLPVNKESSLSETAAFLGQPSGNARLVLGNLDKLLQARTAWTEYQSALTALIAESGSAEGLIRLARALYANEQNNALFVADEAWQSLAASLEARNPDLSTDTLVLSLVRAPLRIAAEVALAEAAQNLQQRWSTEVIGPVEGLEGEALQRMLIGNGGILWRFVADVAQPFLQSTAQGYVAASALGMRFPLATAFTELLSSTPQHLAVHPASYPVRVMFSPVTVNPGAKAYPRGLTLRMDCGGQSLRIDAYNYQESALFNWSPEHCGSLKLSFLFDGFAAETVYAGPLGFAHFVEQAASGIMTFTPADFSDTRQKLEALGITELRTHFRIEGAEGVRQRLLAPPALMRSIISVP